jgi:nitroreductase
MKALEAIFTRRSVREFTPEPLPDDVLERILRAGMQAPSAGNQQPWHFLVVQDRGLLEEIARIHPYAQMCRTAAAAVLVCGDSTLEKFPGYWVQDCSAATQNILLAAHALGYGAVWVGIHPRAERVAVIRELLRVPETVHPLCLVPLGRPANAPPAADRFQPSRVRRDRWE